MLQDNSAIRFCPICRGTGLQNDSICPACQAHGLIIEQPARHSARHAILRARAVRDAARRVNENTRVLHHKIWTAWERRAALRNNAAPPVSLPLAELLHKAMKVSCAEFGTMQSFEPSTGSLRIVAHKGFDDTFLRYFAEVRPEPGSACGAAMGRNARVVVLDVQSDAIFRDQESRDVLLESHVRSVQSTPLVTRAGNFVGVLSTHYRRTNGPSHYALERLDHVIAEYPELLCRG